jgi:hypothetical protein
MAIHEIDDVERLKKINAALISRVERSMDQQGNAFPVPDRHQSGKPHQEPHGRTARHDAAPRAIQHRPGRGQ